MARADVQKWFAGNPNLFNVRLLGQACQLAMQPHQRMSLTTQPDQCFIDLMPKALMRYINLSISIQDGNICACPWLLPTFRAF